MSETIERPRRKKDETSQPRWWEHVWVTHPMSDEAFGDAFFEYVLCKGDDRSLRDLRRRARFLIDYICKQEIRESLADYRKEHPVG